jgi:hypothetical protein
MEGQQMFKRQDRIEWFIGPRKLRRTGVVLDIFPSGTLSVHADNMKTDPVRTVLAECMPRVIQQKEGS